MKSSTRLRLIAASASAFLLAGQASAAEFLFNFSTTTPLIGSSGSGSGTITTDGIMFDSNGFTAETITGITGTFNGSNITGLATPFGANNLFFSTGPSFVDGSGLGFMTTAGTSVNLFFQSSASSFRINTINPFTSSFVSANVSAVAAVPEPGTWAMMLMGFGAVGFSMRRRKVRAVMIPQAA